MVLHSLRVLCGVLVMGACADAWGQSQVLQKQLGDGQPTTVAVGGQVIYVIRGSCNSLTGDCGTLTISDVLPPELEVVSCSAAGSFFSAPNGSLTCVAGSGSFSAVRNVFADGASYTLTVTARARLTLTAGAVNVINTVRAGIVGVVCPAPPAALPANCSEASAPPINITAPTPQYRTRKQRIDPAKPEASNGNPTASLQIAAGTQVRYRVQFCSTSASGNLALSDVTLTDTFTNPGGANATTVVNPGGGTFTPPNTLSWTLTAGELNGLLGTTSCVNREFVLAYAAGLALGDNVNNSVTATGTNVNGGGLGPGPLTSTVLDQIGGPTPGASISKAGNDVTPPGQINWSLSMNNTNSNVPLDDFVVVDSLPRNPPSTSGSLPILNFSAGRWPDGNALDYNIVADLYATTEVAPGACDGVNANWVLVTGGSGVAANANTTFTPPALSVNALGICWRFRNTNPANPLNQVPRGFSFTTAPVIRQTVPAATPLGIVQNCIAANWSGPGVPGSAGPSCRNQNIEVPLPAINAGKTRIAPNTGNLEPLQEFAYRLTFSHVNNDSTGSITDPTVADLLPANVEFMGWTAYAGPAGKPAPNLTVIPNFLPGRTLLRFTWSAAAPPGSTQLNGTLGVANPAQFETTIAAGQMPRMDISLRIRAGTAPGNGGTNPDYRNSVAITENGPNGFTCASGQQIVDTLDLDGDGDTTESMCATTSNYTVVQAAVLEGEKWVRGDFATLPNVDDPTDAVTPPGGVCPDYLSEYPASTVGAGYTRFPCVARTDHGGAFDYVLRVSNGGNQDLDAYVLYDVLPFVGDTGSGQPLATTPRSSSWRPLMTGPIQVVSSAGTPAFVIEYSTAAPGTMCRPEVSNGAGPFLYNRGNLPLPPTFWQPGCDDSYTAAPVDFSQVTGFRIRGFSATTFPVLGVLEFRVPMQAPASGAPPSVIGNPAIFFPSWNSFAHTAFVAGSGTTALPLPTAEPRKVGIVLPERYRVGNLVWNDLNNNGIAELGEPGIDGVQVRLCRDTDGTPGPSAGDTVVATRTTATEAGQAGKYGFDTLLGGNDYYVAVLGGQTPLRGFQSSSNGEEANPNADGDNNDNGLNSFGFVSICGGVSGLPSGLITLGPSGATEPTNEVLRSGSGIRDDSTPSSFPLPGSGFGGYPDGLSNHSVDFGFFLLTDLGDLPDGAAGIGAGNYRTLMRGPGDNGPVHIVVPGLRLGACVDAELDGQPNAAASGDDGAVGVHAEGVCATAGDDEDGITLADLTMTTGQAAVVRAVVTNTSGAPARLCGFADLNADGDFADANEVAFIDLPNGINNGSVMLNFGTLASNPAVYNLTPPSQPRYFRFRLSNNQDPCTPDNDATIPDGEVEDYVGALVVPIDRGDLPDTGPGVGPGNYETLIANGGPGHPLRPDLYIGACVDAEADGQPNADANGDDLGLGSNVQGSCAVAGDDEDGFVTVPSFLAGAPTATPVTVFNNTGVMAQLCAFIDWNRDGDFLDTVDGVAESIAISVPSGAAPTAVMMDFGNAPLAIGAGVNYLRLRLSTDGGACNANGLASDGEVEDYRIVFQARDFGDLPDTGPGTGPGNYQTLAADNGASHGIVPGVFLGAGVDAESDGQPTVDADGDDLNGDDEDGVVFPGVQPVFAGRLVAGLVNPVQITASVNGFLNCFFDFNGNGSLIDAGEHAFNETAVVAGTQTLNLTVPLAAGNSNLYFRCRFSDLPLDGNSPVGPAERGEVEDGVVPVLAADLGDLPDTSAATASGDYQTLIANAGPIHGMVSGLRIGACVDSEANGQPNAAADGDDNGSGATVFGTCASSNDDEDGINLSDLDFIATLPANVRATVTNTTGTAALLCGFVDWNGDGDFDDTVGGTPEAVSVAVPDGLVDAEVILAFGNAPVAPVGTSYARFRLQEAGLPCAATGAALTGEVEDYPVTITRRDFGDLPDSAPGTGVGNYHTLLSDNGAAHDIVDGLHMGALVDPEGDGQPSVNADGDDLNGPIDDEDGANLSDLANFHLGSPANLRVTATNTAGFAAKICGFIDWNRDGDFDDQNERAEIAVPHGSNGTVFTLAFGPVPSFGPLGNTYARLRLQRQQTPCSPQGLVDAGEVEDYVVTVLPGEMSLGNLVWRDRDNSGTFNAGDTPFPGIPVELFRDSDDDGIPDGPAIANTTTDANGLYLFDELVPDTYIVCIDAPVEWVSSSGTGRRYAPVGPTEPAVDPDDDVNDDDNGTAGTSPTRICSLGVTLGFGQEPVNDGDSDPNSNLSVDFGLLYNFDLALRKVLSPGQTFEVDYNDIVSYTITIFNQGTVSARDIVITDWVPAGMQLQDAAWVAGAGSTVSRTIAGPLAPGANTSVTLALRVLESATPGILRNVAEISSVRDIGGNPVPDILDRDSDPDDSLGDVEVDNEIDNAGGDEDDSDPENVNLGFGLIGVAKETLGVTINTGSYGQGALSGTGNVSLRFTLRNYGDRPVSALSLVDSLSNAIPGATITIQSLTATGGLAVNPAYNGVSNTEMLAPGQVLAAGATATLSLDFLVRGIHGGNAAIYFNAATLSGTAPGGIALVDQSVNGSDPDANGNGDPSDDTSPTPIDLRVLAWALPVPALSPWATLLLLGFVLLLARRRLA